MSHEIETADIFRGAYLLCCGGRVCRVTSGRGGQVVFIIEGEGLPEEDVRYRTGNARVNPLQLRETLNLLRDMIFERTRARAGRPECFERTERRERSEVHGAHTA